MQQRIMADLRRRVPTAPRRHLLRFARRLRRLLHPPRRLRRLRHPARFGTLRRTTPLSQIWGFDRGTPVDRHYIARFLELHRQDIRGRVIEIHDSDYTDRYGTGVESCDVLDITPANLHATIVADLTAADAVPADRFDCFVLTQTLHLIYHPRAAIAHAHRILRPGGVLLATVPTVSRVIPESDRQPDYWRFTPAAIAALVGEVFGAEQVTVHPYGNVLASIASLSGVAAEELSPDELAANDVCFPVVVGVRALKR